MKRWLEYTLTGIAVAVITTGTAILSSNVDKDRESLTCSAVSVEFADELEFVTEDNVKNFLEKRFGILIGKCINDISLWSIEDAICSKGVIRDCQAYITRDGVLHTVISQRRPLARFTDNEGRGFYSDSDGYLFPLHKEYFPDVLEIRGEIPVKLGKGHQGPPDSAEEKEWTDKVLNIVKDMEGTGVWRGKLEGIHIMASGDFALKLKDGDELFIIGDNSRLEQKLEGITKYYCYIRKDKGESCYKTVNLKYNGQIICRKDI